MKTNTRVTKKPVPVVNHEGVKAHLPKPLEQLRRTVLACMLWEDGFYEDGETIAERVKRIVPLCKPHEVAQLAIMARTKFKLRHVPLLLMRELARDSKRYSIKDDLAMLIHRADEPAEFLSMYWGGKEKTEPLANQIRKGLAKAIQKFDAYQLAKYARNDDRTKIRLQDVISLVRAKPRDEKQAELWKQLFDGTLPPANTWETRLSSGEDKKTVFENLLKTKKLGYLALLRNLRKMTEVGVDPKLIDAAIIAGGENSWALPFRFIAAAKHAPKFTKALDIGMQASLKSMPQLPGQTAILVDVSPSMDHAVSKKSDLTRIEAACALAILACGICERPRVFAFSSTIAEVIPYAGLGLADSIRKAVPSNGTILGGAVRYLAKAATDADRIIVITDEESQDVVPAPHTTGYMINVATSEKGVSYKDWTHITGFSEAVIRFVAEVEEIVGFSEAPAVEEEQE